MDPEGAPAIDWSGKLPGRGAHACLTPACLEELRRGGLSRSFKSKVRVPAAPWPMNVVEDRARKRQRDLLGLAHRSGVLKSGGNVVAGLLPKRWPSYLILSADAGDRVRTDWTSKARTRAIPVYTTLLSSEEFGTALGRSGTRSIAAVANGGPSTALRKALKQGAAFI